MRNHGLTNVRWAEVGNEPNSGGVAAVSLAEYEALVRALDAELRARGLRDHLRMMGPGLVENAVLAVADALRLDDGGSPPTWATSSTPGASTCTGSTTTRGGSSTGFGTSGTC